MHARSLCLSPLHTSPPVRPLLCIFFPPFPSLAASTRSRRHTNTPSPRSNAHITIHDQKTPVDHLCMYVRAPQPGAYTSGRRGLKDEREIMKCVFWPPQGREEDSRRHRLDSDLVYIKVSFTRGATDPPIITSELWACIITSMSSKATLINMASPLAWWDMTLQCSEWIHVLNKKYNKESVKRRRNFSKCNISCT